ncbi:carbohydrate-binding protein [Chitinophaga horti]|uniref:Carbohydrate-binding protein n=1 Tax=Chitinophaga horti TaxID=2920382 RepID=A0ABY6J2V3_9BACT|nr:carbohydrate-binding protein [Chitinophaga horti]UYQ92639.1 carbohydrate-binding protein [Chitinophaga horti]
MKNKISTLMVMLALLLCGRLQAQFLLFDDMEGNGPCSGHWNYFIGGPGATGSVNMHVPNPSISGLNLSSHVARFTKDTTCSEWMSAGCTLTDSLDISRNSVFKLLVYSSLKEEVLFKLQPGSDYTKAVYFTYKIKTANTWEEASFNFASVKNRKDFNRIEVHFMDGKVANGTLYFDLVQGPNPVLIKVDTARIAMGQEDGVTLTARLYGARYDSSLTKTNWQANLPAGVTIDSVIRLNDTTAQVVLAGNSGVNYSSSNLTLTVAGAEVQDGALPVYTASGLIVLEGNPNWTLVFADEFTTTGMPDFSKWTVDPRPKGWINGEQQVYTDTSFDNTRQRNGYLVITGKKDYPNIVTTEPWSSGRIITQNKFDFKYGKVEVRAKLPKARGSWPAIWLMPTSSAYGAWPKSGEIDIMEHVGNRLGNVLSTVHTQNSNWTNGGHSSGNRTISDAHTAFHNYIMEWNEDSIRFTYDSIHCYTYKNPRTDWKDWPFDQKFHVILNLAIGGGMGGAVTDADWPDSLLIDYVHVYQKGLGTPVLDSMNISPLNRAVVAGKTQPYEAKLFDQNDRAISVTPTWSITGTGNTINASGLATIQSPGTVTASATHNGVTLIKSTSVTLRTPNYKPVPARIEAENNDYTNVCCTETASDTSGGLNASYIANNSWLEYDITTPSADAYRFQFRVAVNTVSTIQIVKDHVVLATVKLPASGGWQSWSTVTTASINLPAGNQTIRIQALTSGWNFNWLRIIKASDLNVARVVITPDSTSVSARGRKQFTAAAYGADNSKFDLPITWQAQAGAGSFDAYKGIFTADSLHGIYNIYATAGGVTDTAKINVLAPPRLARIEVVPDTIVIPYNASQLFTAKGFDQYNSPFAFTAPTWSVTGTGNTITQAGALTARNNPGIVTATKDSISGSGVFTLDYICTFNKRYEAESASSRSSVPTLETTSDTSGGQNFTGIAYGHWFAYNKVAIPVRGRYNIRFRVASNNTSQIRMEESGTNFGYINIPNTNGQWVTVSDTITLPGIGYINVRVNGAAFKFNWWSLDNCAVDTSTSMMAVSQQRIVYESLSGTLKPYPNPTTGNITLELGEHDYQWINLLDLNGRLIRRWATNPGDRKFTQDVSALESGTYIIRLEGRNGAKSVQFVKL